MANKKGEDKDVAADFFGESDLDWLDDEEDAGSSIRERLPVAPPPPPPFQGQARTATPLEEPPPEWRDAPDAKLSSAPTLIFSSVPTLPPEPALFGEEAETSTTRLADPGVALDAHPPVADIPTSEQPTVEVEPLKVAPPPAPAEDVQDSIPTVLAPNELTDAPVEESPAEVFGDAFDDQVVVETPLVRSAEPAPARIFLAPAPAAPPPPVAPNPAPKPEPRPAPAPAPAPAAAAWEPVEGDAAWGIVQGTLVREAGVAAGSGAGVLLARAAWIAEHRVGDLAATSALYADARAAGATTPDILRAHAETLGRLGRFDEQAATLAEAGGLSEGTARAADLLEAGLVAWRRLNRPTEAVEHLRGAAAADPTDYTSRALLRALLPSVGATDTEARVALLGELAALAEGGIAADAWLEAATAAEEGSDAGPARACLEAALQAEPGHAGAFLRLERLFEEDPAALASLYEAEAVRPGQVDAGWWHAEAARAWQRAGRDDAAAGAFQAAVDAGHVSALRELQGAWTRAGAWADLARALQREAEASTAELGSAFAWFRLGWVRESRLGDAEGAVAAYRNAVAADPDAAPAGDAVARLLGANEDERRAIWAERLASATEPAERHALLLRLAESAEASGAHEEARDRYQAIATDGASGVVLELATDGLDRMLQALGDALGLRQARRARAAATPDAADRATWLLLAALAGDVAEGADDLLLEALEARPDHPGALATIAPRLQGPELAVRLWNAADAADDADRRAAHLYRAARLFAEQAQDPVSARSCAENALAAAPGFRPVRWLLRSLGSTTEGLAAQFREDAAAASDPAAAIWPRFAAAVMSASAPEARADLDAILGAHPDHPGARAALEALLVAEGDDERIAALYLAAAEGEPSHDKARLAARAASLLATRGDARGAIQAIKRVGAMPVDVRPIRAVSRLALRLGARDLALDLLAGSSDPEDRTERARLLALAGRPAEALPILRSLLDDGQDPVGAAARTATVAQQLGDAEAMLRAYVTIARRASSASLTAAYGAWTGMQLQGTGNAAEALEFWRIALEARPASPSARAGVVRGLVARRDVPGLLDVLSDTSPEIRAAAVADAGDPVKAAEVLSVGLGAIEGDAPRHLAALIFLERLHEEAGDWSQAYAALTRRRALCGDPAVQADADAKRRWMLAEKLADSDAAWDMYRKLHEDAPEDVEVTEALARIAGARGEVALAIGYLRELADGASVPEEAARYQRRVGEVYERAGQGASARQAYLDALDHVRTDPEALGGLRRLAEQDEDWSALIAVLEREAGLVSGERLVELRRQIAQVTEDEVGDPAVAMDKWRALVEIAPRDRQALEHLLALSRELAEWGVFVDSGIVLAELVEGAERGRLLRDVGIACERLGREDAISFYERATSIDPPDLDAARRLARLARARADWSSVIQALGLQAHPSNDEQTRVEALLSAARVEIEARHDREAAAAFYQRALALRPDHEPALRFMATHLFDTGRHDDALPICERLEPMVESGQDLEDFDTRMELSSFYFSFAEILRRQGREEDAIPRYERALELNPTHLPSLEAVGPLFIETAAWKKAEGVYRQLLQLSGGHGDREKMAEMYTSLGLVERHLQDGDKAYRRFSKALELRPNHIGALKGIALVLEDRGDWSNLLNVYNTIIFHAAVHEDVIDAYMTKGRILDDQMQRQDKAAQHYQRSLDFEANQPVAYLRLAELAMRRDGYDEAGKLAERALQLDDDLVQPFRALLLVVRAAALQHGGHAIEAERCLREAGMRDRALVAALGDAPLGDLVRLRQGIRGRLP